MAQDQYRDYLLMAQEYRYCDCILMAQDQYRDYLLMAQEYRYRDYLLMAQKYRYRDYLLMAQEYRYRDCLLMAQEYRYRDCLLMAQEYRYHDYLLMAQEYRHRDCLLMVQEYRYRDYLLMWCRRDGIMILYYFTLRMRMVWGMCGTDDLSCHHHAAHTHILILWQHPWRSSTRTASQRPPRRHPSAEQDSMRHLGGSE